MRGRTNIPNRKTPIINGDLRSFTVAQNNTIAKGDFVSYKMATSMNALDIAGLIYGSVYDGGRPTNYYVVDEAKNVFLFNSKSDNQYCIRLAKVNANDEVEMIDAIFSDENKSYDFYMMYAWYDKTEGILSVRRYGNVSGSNQYYFEFYDVSENGFTRHQETYLGSTIKSATGSARDIFYFMKISNNFVAVNEYGVIYTLDSNLTLLNATATGYGNFNFIKRVERYDENSIVFVGDGYNTSGQDGIYITLYNFNTYDIVKFRDSQETVQHQFIVQDKVVISVGYSSSGGSSIYYVRMYKLDEVEGWVRFYNTTLTGNSSLGMCGIFGVNKFFLIINNGQYAQIYLLEHNKSTSEVTVVQNELQQFEASGGWLTILGFIKGNTIFGLSGNKYCKMTYENSKIVVGEPTSYVREYDGQSALGFAQTGGTAGDTIQVYVPPVSV